jgi:D-sedoheptulose 7-phosphate isomerase
MNSIAQQLHRHQQVVQALSALAEPIQRIGERMVQTLQAGGKLLLCGNGGSAADAQHIAAELVGRFIRARAGLPAIALTTDTSALTAIANDFGYEQVFARQVQALARPGDLLVGISTSGNSANVLKAVEMAHAMGVHTVGLLGGSGGALAGRVNDALVVPSPDTPRIQECHILLGHIWCQMIDDALSDGAP